MKKYVLADDDEDDKDIFCEALKEIDLSSTCYCAKDGQEVIDKLVSGQFQLPEFIFLDINMPGMNGWECLIALKKDASFKDIPVIMHSTSSSRREKELAEEFGATGFFTKPTKFSQLIKILAFLMSKTAGDTAEIKAFLANL